MCDLSIGRHIERSWQPTRRKVSEERLAQIAAEIAARHQRRERERFLQAFLTSGQTARSPFGCG